MMGTNKMRLFSIYIIFILLIPHPSLAANYQPNCGDFLIADFESTLNCLNGSVNCFGAAAGSGYTNEFAYSGKQSYKLVFEKDCMWRYFDEGDSKITGTGIWEMKKIGIIPKQKKITWALFLMTMGPVGDASQIPVKVQPFDMSGFKYLIFWVKGRRGSEQFNIYFNDIHAKSYYFQLGIKPRVRVSSDEWREVRVNLQRLKNKIDLKKMTKIGIGFGQLEGGKPGNVFYIDNFILVK